MNKERFSKVFIFLVHSSGWPDRKLVMHISVNCRKGVNSWARSIKIFYPSHETWKKISLNWKKYPLGFKLGKRIQFIKLDISNWNWKNPVQIDRRWGVQKILETFEPYLSTYPTKVKRESPSVFVVWSALPALSSHRVNQINQK